MQPTTNPIRISEGAMKAIGFSAGAITVITLVGVGFYIYKNILDSTKTRLEITVLKRQLGADAPNKLIDRLSNELV